MGIVQFNIFTIMFSMVSLLIFGVFLAMIIRSIRQWNKNNHSPRLTVSARVVAKRTQMHRHHHDDTMHHHVSTTYYVTFQVESGDRMELSMSGQEYGLLIEGDNGRLSFQGTRYLGFERTR